MSCQNGYTDKFLKKLNDISKNISFTVENAKVPVYAF